MKKFLMVLTVAVISGSHANAQYVYRDGNRIGISGGITQTTLLGSNFIAKPELGWIGGLSVRGNYYNDFSMTFGMQFTESSFSLETVNPLLQREDVKYTLSGVQVRVLLGYNLIEDHLAVELGPVLQVNGKLRIDKDNKNNILPGTLLTANDIIEVTPINGNLYFGITAGSKRVKAIIFYEYGINNFMNKLNKDEDLKTLNNGDEFKGHIGMLSGQILISL